MIKEAWQPLPQLLTLPPLPPHPHNPVQGVVSFSVLEECSACLEMHSTETCSFLFRKSIKPMSLSGQLTFDVD